MRLLGVVGHLSEFVVSGADRKSKGIKLSSVCDENLIKFAGRTWASPKLIPVIAWNERDTRKSLLIIASLDRTEINATLHAITCMCNAET